MQNKNLKTYIFTAFLFIAFAGLIYLFPYSGDDWAWGCQIGIDRLKSLFEGYNGRYAGNLLVIALTRSELLNMLVTGASLVCVCLFPKLYASSGSFMTYAFGTVLFLIIPKEILVQSVVWTSGFSNYIPPVLLTVLYFIAVKNIFENDEPEYKPYLPVAAAFIGFVSALFMENVTLYNVAASALIVFYVFLRFRKVYLVHVLHFFGCVAGAFLMFTNSAYGFIAKGNDFYRTTALESGVAKTIIENTKEIFEQFFCRNVTALTVVSVLLAVLCFTFSASAEKRKHKYIAFAALSVNAFALGVLYFKNRFEYWELFIESEKSGLITVAFFTVVSALWFAAAVVIMLICIDCRKTRDKTLLLMLSIPVLIAPLVVVTPIGPRCFFPPYLMLSGVSVMLLSYLQGRLKLSRDAEKGIAVSMVSVSLASIVFLFSIYSVIHNYDVKRNDYVKKQLDSGFKKVIVYYLPYSSYVWNGDPDSEPWDDRYKRFYGIDEDVSFKFILRENFDDFARNFTGE